MKILNWNIYKNNRDIHRAIEFLREQDADVICLQEFPIKYFHLLESLGGSIIAYKEIIVYKDKNKPKTKVYSVIISRFPIYKKGVISHKKHYQESRPKRDQYAYFKADSFYIDIDTHQGPFRIFNAHFRYMAGPNHRISQFQEVIGQLDAERKNVVCGDFNSFGKPLINILLFKLFGFKAWEIKINETKTIARIFEACGLKNPLQKQVTFAKYPVQLDYILVPSQIEVKSKRAFMRLYGSDHFPLMLEI